MSGRASEDAAVAPSARLTSAARPVWATRPGRGEVALAVVAFAVLCLVVLRVAPQLVEPDDWAYRASIVGITEGHLATLSAAQVHALSAQLIRLSGGNAAIFRHGPQLLGVQQWVRLPDGHWISEKDPGYPYLAAPFQWLGILRWAPLFYGALACLGLFAGARRWLGRLGGAAAVGLYCSSGAALLFAWRDYMPTFTDASLIAAGAGALLWTLLADDAPGRRRTVIGLAGFVALELAAFARYSDVVVLGCAILAVAVLRWRRPAALPPGALTWWLGSAVLFGAGVAAFDTLVYGGPLRSGYQAGEIRFTLGSLLPNLRLMPAHLLRSMPFLVLGIAALAWIAARWLRLRRRPAGHGQAAVQGEDGPAGDDPARDDTARRDAAVGLALGAAWLAIWGLYAFYSWTAFPGLSTLQAARFYVPALGPMALLAAWLVTRVPGRPAAAGLTATAVVAGLFALGIASFHGMTAFHLGGPHVVHGHPPPGSRLPRSRPGSG